MVGVEEEAKVNFFASLHLIQFTMLELELFTPKNPGFHGSQVTHKKYMNHLPDSQST
jgi:hypothetical protein